MMRARGVTFPTCGEKGHREFGQGSDDNETLSDEFELVGNAAQLPRI